MTRARVRPEALRSSLGMAKLKCRVSWPQTDAKRGPVTMDNRHGDDVLPGRMQLRIGHRGQGAEAQQEQRVGHQADEHTRTGQFMPLGLN